MVDVSGPHAFFGGLVGICEATEGHRAGTDAVLLAASAPDGFAGRVIDAGAGSGVVGLAVAARCPAARATLVEIDPTSAAIAADNVAANGLADRVDVIRADLLAPARSRADAGLVERSADLVLTNPPFHPAGRVRRSPNGRRAGAHVLSDEDLIRWVKACGTLLVPKGEIVMIHRPEALRTILDSLSGTFGGIMVLPIHARQDRPAVRVLVRATKGSRAPLALRPGLVLQDEEGRPSPAADAVARGRALVEW
jgi:tRNA1(Val) A37 N6-methylase TrmN6